VTPFPPAAPRHVGVDDHAATLGQVRAGQQGSDALVSKGLEPGRPQEPDRRGADCIVVVDDMNLER
jgi:hypothetical protein